VEHRVYDPAKDKKAAHRIWAEVGWLEQGPEEATDCLIEAGRALVADIRGEAECMVTTMPGVFRYLAEDLPFCAVTSVATSHIARRQGLAARLLARIIAEDAADGALMAGLGMFDQGFYNRLGFGTGAYEHWVAFDPATLDVATEARVPYRLTLDDWEKVHASRLARKRRHGACSLFSPAATRAEMLWTSNSFGLGYYDGSNGELTHHLWGASRGENGPYGVWWLSYRTGAQFLELMALLKGISDQVRMVRMNEPPGIQLQDLLKKPFRLRQITRKSEFENVMRSTAYWQVRICDLEKCLERTHLRGEALRFNLKLHDPLERYLDEGAPWRGVGGDYVATLGSDSGAERGVDHALPTLDVSVGAFTRLWLGVRPATSLAVTDHLSGPQELLEALDWALCLPEPHLDWDF
jgi:GNAT superfamily N-acetyltransferase